MDNLTFEEMMLLKTNSQLADIVYKQRLFKNKNTLRERVLESFKNTADFTSIRANLTQSTTTFKTGTSALSVECTTAGNWTQIEKSGLSLNLANDNNFEIKLYVADKSHLNNVTLYFYNAGGGYYSGLWSCNGSGQNGWNTARWAKSRLTQNGTISWNDTITKIQVVFNLNASYTPTVILEPLKCNVKEHAYFMFQFDDGFASAYAVAKPKLDQYGYKGSVALNSNKVGTASYLTLAQCTELYNAGWDMINHTATHSNLSTGTYTQVIKDIQDMQQWLVTNGFNRSVDDFFAYPTGWSAMGEQVIKDLNFVAARDSVGSINYWNAPNYLKLQALSINASTANLSSITPYIDILAACGGIIIFYVHNIVDSPTGVDCSRTLWESAVDYVNGKGSAITVITPSEWIKTLF